MLRVQAQFIVSKDGDFITFISIFSDRAECDGIAIGDIVASIVELFTFDCCGNANVESIKWSTYLRLEIFDSKQKYRCPYQIRKQYLFNVISMHIVILLVNQQRFIVSSAMICH